MSITIKTINENEYTFVNHSRSNSSGFVHETELYKNGTLWGKYRIQYINRTWESYQFQSVMRRAVNSILCEEIENFEKRYRTKHNIKRLTKAKREAMMQDYSKYKPAYIEEFEKLYIML